MCVCVCVYTRWKHTRKKARAFRKGERSEVERKSGGSVLERKRTAIHCATVPYTDTEGMVGLSCLQ